MASWHSMKTPVFKPTHMFTQTILCLVIKLFLISLQGQLSNCCYCYVANHCRWDADPKEISSFYNSKKSCGPDYGNNTTIHSSQGADVCGLWAGIGPRAGGLRCKLQLNIPKCPSKHVFTSVRCVFTFAPIDQC